VIDPFDYMNKLTKISGTNINPYYLLITNPILWFKYVFSSYSLFSYRINDKNTNRKKIALKYIDKYHHTEVATTGILISFGLLLVFYILPITFYLNSFC
jgi:hypothetical protein